MSQYDFDVGIIGGGPAGSSMGAYLAKAGLKCAVFEGELFPRPHVGESLVPSSTRVFKELGFLDQMEEAGFPRKYGAAWTSTSAGRVYRHDWQGLEARGHADILFAERDQVGVDMDYTYHVDRGLFDLLLLQHARRLGATVYDQVSVKSVDFSDPLLPQIKYKVGATEGSTRVRMVVDASGRKTLLGNQLRLKIKDPVFDQYALHTWFQGYDRDTLANKDSHKNYIFVHFLPITNSWVWQIPITETITSIGVVTQKKNFAKARAEREDFFWSCIGSRPNLLKALKEAKQLRPLKDEGDYSYAMKDICGDGFVLVGDAGRFVDPIFSTGVSIALNSARFASADIIRAADIGDFRKERFKTFETTIRRGTRNWHEFISLYYRLNILFTAFVQDRRYRLDVLKLLQGDVYDEDRPEVLTVMETLVAEVEQNKNHPWHNYLGDLTANAFKSTF